MLINVVAATAVDQLQGRVYILLAALGIMFVIALPIAFGGSRLRRRKITNDLSFLTGTAKGAQSGKDGRHVDDEWWHEQQAGDGAPSQPNRWQQAILPPGSRPIEPPPPPLPSGRTGAHRGGSSVAHVPPPQAVFPPNSTVALPSISPRPGPPQPAADPVVSAPVAQPSAVFDGTDADNSLGDGWFDQAMEDDK